MVIVSLFDQYRKGNEDACVLILFYAFILKSSTEDVILLKAYLYYKKGRLEISTEEISILSFVHSFPRSKYCHFLQLAGESV